MFPTATSFACSFHGDPVLLLPRASQPPQTSIYPSTEMLLSPKGPIFCRDSQLPQTFRSRTRGFHLTHMRSIPVSPASSSDEQFEDGAEDESFREPVSNVTIHAKPSSASPDVAGKSHLNLLEELTSKSNEKSRDHLSVGDSRKKKTIAQQLSNKVRTEADQVAVPLAKKIILDYDDLTIAQRRNIRRQQYLDQVSKRDDGPFFLALALFIIVPPTVILGVAFATGYIELLP